MKLPVTWALPSTAWGQGYVSLLSPTPREGPTKRCPGSGAGGQERSSPSSHPLSAPVDQDLSLPALGWFGPRRGVTHSKAVGGGRLSKFSGSLELTGLQWSCPETWGVPRRLLEKGVASVALPLQPHPKRRGCPRGPEQTLPGDTIFDVVEQTFRHQGVFVQVHQVWSLVGRGRQSGEGRQGCSQEGGKALRRHPCRLPAAPLPLPRRVSSPTSCSHLPQCLRGSLTHPLLAHKMPSPF